jgi:hypothetical protein
VLVERVYRQRMRPRLLSDLFGDGPAHRTTAVALDELVQSGSTIPPATISPRPRPASYPDRALGLLRGRSATALMVASVAATLCFALIARSHRAAGAAPPRASIAQPRVARLTPEFRPLIQPMPPPAPVSRTAGPTLKRSASSGTIPPAKRRWTLAPTAVRKPVARKPRAPSPDAAGLITSGRPIDPFAEEASRSPGP